MVNAMVKKSALYLGGAGALNWGLGLLNVNLLSFLPAGAVSTIVVAAIGVSGAFVLWETFKGRL